MSKQFVPICSFAKGKCTHNSLLPCMLSCIGRFSELFWTFRLSCKTNFCAARTPCQLTSRGCAPNSATPLPMLVKDVQDLMGLDRQNTRKRNSKALFWTMNVGDLVPCAHAGIRRRAPVRLTSSCAGETLRVTQSDRRPLARACREPPRVRPGKCTSATTAAFWCATTRCSAIGQPTSGCE